MLYRIGSFILNTRRNVLLLSDKTELSDTFRIVRVLQLLAESYPDFTSKEKIIAEIWPDSDVSEASLSRLIADLRKLLASCDSTTVYIKTVHRKGFKLTVSPVLISEESIDERLIDEGNQNSFSSGVDESSVVNTLPEQIAETEAPNLAAPNKNRDNRISKTKIMATGAFTLLVAATTLGWYVINAGQPMTIEYPDLTNEGREIVAAHTRVFSLTDNYWANGGVPIIYDERGVSLQIKGHRQMLTSHIVGPENAFLSTVKFQVELDQTYKDSGADLQVFGQNQEKSWPGEWDCITPNNQLVVGLNEVSCQLNEPEAIFHLDDGESMRMGISSWGESPKGLLTIKLGQAEILPSLPMDSGWYTTATNQKIEYNNGVHFYPEHRGERLFFYIKGPVNLENTIMHMAISADQEFVDSIERIRPFAQSFIKDNPGVWECWIGQDDILLAGDTYSCKIGSITDAFILAEDEIMQLGLDVEGRKIRGRISVLGVNFESEPESAVNID